METMLGVGRRADKLAACVAEVTWANRGHEQSDDYGGKPPKVWGQ